MSVVKCKMLLENMVNTASLTLAQGVELPSLPLNNLKVYSNGHRFRSESVEQVVINGTFIRFSHIGGVVMYRHNLSAMAKWRLELFRDRDQTGDVLFDTGLVPVYQTKLLNELEWGVDDLVTAIGDKWQVRYKPLWLPETLALSFRLTIEDPVNKDGFIDIARLYMGRVFEPFINFSLGSNIGVGALEKQIRTGDSLHTEKRSNPFRRFGFTFNHIPEADRAELFNHIYRMTTDADWFLSLYPGEGYDKEHQHAMACKFVSLPSFSRSTDLYSKSTYLMEEC